MTAATADTLAETFDEVLAAARDGDAGAFRTLYAGLAGPVAGYVRGHGVRDVEDVTSEVFLAVFTGVHRFVGGLPEFRSWVFTIAHRRVVDEWRRAGRSAPLLPYEPAADPRTAASAETDALVALGDQQVRRLLAGLSRDQRDVLLLRVVGDLTVHQVANALGKPVSSVKALQRRGLAALRRAATEEGVPR